MHTVTWISINGIESISSPKLSSIHRVYNALLKQGKCVRMWHNGALVL